MAGAFRGSEESLGSTESQGDTAMKTVKVGAVVFDLTEQTLKEIEGTIDT